MNETHKRVLAYIFTHPNATDTQILSDLKLSVTRQRINNILKSLMKKGYIAGQRRTLIPTKKALEVLTSK